MEVSYEKEWGGEMGVLVEVEKKMSLDDMMEVMNDLEKVNIGDEGESLMVE